jgi:hypothetical protein
MGPVVTQPCLLARTRAAHFQKMCTQLRLLRGWPLGVPFTSLQANTGACKPHMDKANVGLSIACAFGVCYGGRLGYEVNGST